MKPLRSLALVVAVIATVLATPRSALARDVEVVVTVLNAGVPMQGVNLFLRVDRAGERSPETKSTDPNGVCRWIVETDGASVAAQVHVVPPLPDGNESAADYKERYGVYQNLVHDFTFKRAYRFIIEGEAATARVQIDVVDAISATVRVTSGGRAIERPMIVGSETDITASRVRDGLVSIGGIPPDTEYPVYVLNENTLERVVVPASKTDLDLGERSITAWSLVADLEVSIAEAERCDRFYMLRHSGFALVGLCGNPIISFLSADAANPVRTTSGEVPRGPAGRFCVLPFAFMAREAQVRLIERAAAGEDLSLVGVPVVELRAGETTSVTLSAFAVEQEGLRRSAAAEQSGEVK